MISKSNVKCTDSNVKFADSEVRMASRFASSTQQEIEKLLEDKVSVISLSLRLRLITLTSTLIIPDITKTSSNNCLKTTWYYILLRILSISKFFVYCCHSDIDFTKNCILTNFNSYSITGEKFAAIGQGQHRF